MESTVNKKGNRWYVCAECMKSGIVTYITCKVCMLRYETEKKCLNCIGLSHPEPCTQPPNLNQ